MQFCVCANELVELIGIDCGWEYFAFSFIGWTALYLGVPGFGTWSEQCVDVKLMNSDTFCPLGNQKLDAD